MKIFISLLLLLFSVNRLNAKELLFSKVYDLAVKNSSKVHSANDLHLADKEDINQVEAALYPQLDLSAYYKKTKYTTNPAKHKIRQGLLSATLSLKQSLYTPDTYSRVAMQKARSKYSSIDVKLQKQQLAQDVFKAYLNILKAKSKIEAQKSYLQYLYSKLEVLKKQYAMQLSNKTDLLEMQVEYSSSKIDLNKEMKLLELYKLQLEHFIGKKSYKIPTINIEDSISPTLAEMRDTLLNKRDSLELKKAAVAVELSEKKVTNAFDGHLPSVTFNASYSSYATDTPTTEAPYNDVSSAMININIPLYRGGATSSRVQSAKLKYKASMEDLEATKKKISITYSEDLLNFNAALDSVYMYKDSYKSATLYVEAVDQSYKKGLKSIIALNDAKAKLYNIKYKYIDNLYTMINAYVGLMVESNSLDNIKFLDQLVTGNRL